MIGWFDRYFVKKNLIDKKFSKIIHKAFKDRKAGDYNVLSKFSKEEVEQSFAEMKMVVFEIQTLIQESEEN